MKVSPPVLSSKGPTDTYSPNRVSTNSYNRLAGRTPTSLSLPTSPPTLHSRSPFPPGPPSPTGGKPLPSPPPIVSSPSHPTPSPRPRALSYRPQTPTPRVRPGPPLVTRSQFGVLPTSPPPCRDPTTAFLRRGLSHATPCVVGPGPRHPWTRRVCEPTGSTPPRRRALICRHHRSTKTHDRTWRPNP